MCHQIYKLEMEQKRVEEDALVYNWLQQQLKLSPAYKKVKNQTQSLVSKDCVLCVQNLKNLFNDVSDSRLILLIVVAV